VKPVVIDSSVLLANAFVEAYSAQASSLITMWLEEGYSLHAPSLLYYEIVNVIRKAVHFGRLVETEGRQVKERLLAIPLTTHANLDLVNRAYDLAQSLNLPRTYDAQYLAVAESLGCEFWTGDERFFNSARSLFPFIRWLGEDTK
jgi:predicted nucleic acid-binding protein